MSVFENALHRKIFAQYNGEDWEDLKSGTVYNVSDISMGQSNTSISLIGHNRCYSSVYFTFYENGKELDIFKDYDFNPYLKRLI